MLPSADVADWLTWPADVLLNVGGWVAGWFFDKDATSFIVVQMMFATLVLAAVVALLAYWETVSEYWKSLWKSKHPTGRPGRRVSRRP